MGVPGLSEALGDVGEKEKEEIVDWPLLHWIRFVERGSRPAKCTNERVTQCIGGWVGVLSKAQLEVGERFSWCYGYNDFHTKIRPRTLFL